MDERIFLYKANKMRSRSKISDFSPLFEGMSVSRSLRIDDREDGRSVLTIHGVKVEGSRPVLERVRDGLLRNGGPQQMNINIQ